MAEKMQIGMIYTPNLVFQENLKGKYALPSGSFVTKSCKCD